MSWASRVATPCSKEKLEADLRAAELGCAIKALKAIGGKYIVYMPEYAHIYPSDEEVKYDDDAGVSCFQVSSLASVDPAVLLDMAKMLYIVESNRVHRRKLLSALRRELDGKNVIWMRGNIVFDTTEDETAHEQELERVTLDRLYGVDAPLDDIRFYYDALVRHRGAGSGSGSDPDG